MLILFRMIQFYLFFLSFLISFNSDAKEIDTLEFIWVSDSISGEFVEKAAILIPVQFINDTNMYYFQFDSGANFSSIYTGNPGKNEFNFKYSYSKTIETNIGSIEFDTLSNMYSFYEDDMLVIGTIGANVFSDKILQIDFPNQRLIFSNECHYENYNLIPIGQSFGRPTIQLSIESKKYEFLFDTGSCVFEMWTTKNIWKKLKRPKSLIVEKTIWSWGKQLKVHSTPIENPISLNRCPNIQILTVAFSQHKQQKKSYKGAGIAGIIGVKPFLNECIMIDVSKNQFGIMKCK